MISSNIRYNSPDGIRPTEDLINRAKINFPRKKPPSPSQLPIPNKLLNKKQEIKLPEKVELKSLSKLITTPEEIIHGKKRTWKVKKYSPYQKKANGVIKKNKTNKTNKKNKKNKKSKKNKTNKKVKKIKKIKQIKK